MKYRTTCKIGACEPFCGIEVTVEDGKMTNVAPDRAHPVTKGHFCIKGQHLIDYQYDPDRLLKPEKRTGNEWATVDWDQAYREIGAKLRHIRETHGPTSIATYWGNAADSMAITLTNSFCHAMGSPNSFNVLSLEYTDRGEVAKEMLGNEHFILQPDAANATFALLIGTNPLVTQGMTLLQRRPRIAADFRAIKANGGQICVVDPRITETSRVADNHLRPVPGTDLFLLLGMLKHIVAEHLYQAEFIDRYCQGWPEWLSVIESVDIDEMAEICQIKRQDIEEVAERFAKAEAAFATTRVGVQTGWNSTITEWMVMSLNIVTGNMDRKGGVYFNPGAIDVPKLIKKMTHHANRSPSRIGGYPQIFGGPPAATFAEDVLSDDPGRIRALVVVAGNPVISFPDTKKIEAALERLDLLVCVDIYRSDTGAFADYNLPAATAFEKDSMHFLTSNFEPYPYVEWKTRLVEPTGDVKSEWEIFMALSKHSGARILNHPWVDRLAKAAGYLGVTLTENLLYRYLLWGKTGFNALRKRPGGRKLGGIPWGRFLGRGLETSDRRIHLAPPRFVETIGKARANPIRIDTQYPFMLISGARRLASYNSWTHNQKPLMKRLNGNWLTMHPDDGKRLGLCEGQRVRVITKTGDLTIGTVLSETMRRGVVSIHQHWGHHYNSGGKTARATPGVNVNLLHGEKDRDPLTGVPVFNGRPCRIEPLPDEKSAEPSSCSSSSSVFQPFEDP